MKLMLTVLLVTFGFTSAFATEKRVNRFYKPNGAYAGRAVHSGGTTRFYRSNGAYDGRAVQSGGSTRYYDRAGRVIGTKR